MESECWCVFHSCLVLEAKLMDDLSAEAKRLTERRAGAYNERAKAKETACRRWKEGGITSETLHRQLEALKAQRDEERVIEEQLKQQRLADERRKHEALELPRFRGQLIAWHLSSLLMAPLEV